MNRLGAEFLKGKGGIIGASTVNNMTIRPLFWTGVFMVPLSGGSLKVKKYDVNGQLAGAQQVNRWGY